MNNHSKLKLITDGAVMLALAIVLSFIRVIKMPWGGSVTLLSMLPVILFSIKHGAKYGLCVSFLFSLFQLAQGITDGLFGWGLTPASLVGCIFIDYIAAYTAVGIGGIFRKNGLSGWISGVVLAGVLRFFFHFLSGVVIWKSYGALWGDLFTENSVLYSLLYNGAYMLPEIIFTAAGASVLLSVPQTKRLLTSDADTRKNPAKA